MQVRKLLQDDDAVSPVIGVILMVAITVILAAVIAAFVLGLGGSDEVSPQTSFDYDLDDSGDGADLTITVQSGDSFTADNVGFTLTGDDIELDHDNWVDAGAAESGDSVSSGAQAELEITEDGTPTGEIEEEFDLNIVWESSDGDDSAIIGGTSGTVTDEGST